MALIESVFDARDLESDTTIRLEVLGFPDDSHATSPRTPRIRYLGTLMGRRRTALSGGRRLYRRHRHREVGVEMT
jgi:hypothetical protein